MVQCSQRVLTYAVRCTALLRKDKTNEKGFVAAVISVNTAFVQL